MTKTVLMGSRGKTDVMPRNKPEYLLLIIHRSLHVCIGSIRSRILVRNHSQESLLSDSTTTNTNETTPLS
ncbi:hypothetical protein AXF42_Ash017140 [Apostasia shenzhenica]|uniref:Uncharacterized protein n=1 Tax=Apostasia shenzhenica TaxID=1088818 RepID=A0A2H9ZV64_9ASPA|nr:hypothetical protein AXF42_Ash017140 [Apostasia shenzhenica]